MTDYNGHTTSYMYTARGELASLTAPGSKVWSFAYNALGQRTQYTHPNGTRTEYGYDTQNRRTSIQHKDASTEAVLLGLTYTLNDGGNITRIDHNDASYWTYGYDNRDRLTGAMRYNTTGNLLHWYGYTYDNADNMTQRWRFQASNSQTDVWNYTYNAGNEQLSMTLNGGTPETRTYDNWGRLATRAQGSYSASYAYRYGSKLYQATSNFPGESNVSFDYGGDGKLRTRTTASETRTYRYDRGWNAVNEEVGGATVASNVFEPGAQVGAILAQTFGTLASGTPVYAYHDHLATVRQWRYPNKNLARANEYDPYGNFYSYSGYMPMPRIYALHEFDLALQQYRAPYRTYSPSMARWTTLDPAGMVDGPNMYAYVRGMPISRNDKMGLQVMVPNPWIVGAWGGSGSGCGVEHCKVPLSGEPDWTVYLGPYNHSYIYIPIGDGHGWDRGKWQDKPNSCSRRCRGTVRQLIGTLSGTSIPCARASCLDIWRCILNTGFEGNYCPYTNNCHHWTRSTLNKCCLVVP